MYSSTFLSYIYRASLSISDDVVIFDSLDGNGALFANVLCEIPVLHISLIKTLGGNIASEKYYPCLAL